MAASMVRGTLTVDPSLVVPGAAAPQVIINNSTMGVSNYAMHWPSPPETGYLDSAVPYNNGNPSPINVVYNGTTYTPTPSSVTIPGSGVGLLVNLTLP